MKDHGGFEGNAQSLRIVTCLEKKRTLKEHGLIKDFPESSNDLRCGLNITYRSAAALLKYDFCIPERNSDRPRPGEIVKGYYRESAPLVSVIKEKVTGESNFNKKFKTIECSIMDIADDIAYSTYDLEDVFKAGFLTPMRLFALDEDIYERVAQTITERLVDAYSPEEIEELGFDVTPEIVKQVLFQVFKDMLFGGPLFDFPDPDHADRTAVEKMMTASEVQLASRKLAMDGYHRLKFTSGLVQDFIAAVEVYRDREKPQLSTVRLSIGAFLFVEVLKNITFYAIIRSPGMQVVEYRGKEIVKSIFNALAGPGGEELLPDDFRAICKRAPELVRRRAICDFIAGMTDRYAFEFYGRLFGTSQLTIHKPL